MRASSTLLGSVAVIVLLALGASAVATASVLRDGGAGTSALVASCGVDEFEGTALDDERWDVVRPIPTGLSVADGKLGLELRQGDLINQTANAENVVLQDAPAGGWTATTKFNISSIDTSGEQAGIVLWRSEGPPQIDNSFGKIMFIQTVDAGTRVIESIWTDRGNLAVPIADSRAPVPTLPADADVLMRLRSDGSLLTAEFSTDDGATWTQAGQTSRYPGNLRVGLVAIRGASGGGMVPFERFELECAPQITAEAASGTAPFEVDLTSTGAPAGADLAWDFGDGQTAQGGDAQTHTFAQPGVYRVRQTATVDGGRRKLTGSTVVTVNPAQPLDPPQPDEFNGNELEPKWEVLRPRDTGLSLSGGHLRLQAYGGDMHGTNATASNVVLQNAPTDCGWTATTRIDISGLTRPEGGEQAGMVLWRSEGAGNNNFAKVVYNRRPNNQWWVERSRTTNSATQGTTNVAMDDIPQVIYMRIRAESDGTVQPERSLDGVDWTAVGTPFTVGGTGPLKVGLTYFSNNTLRRAAFDWFHMELADPCEPPPEPCPAPPAPEEGFSRIWNGTGLEGWRQAGPGSFEVVNDGGTDGCRLLSQGGLGLFWYEGAQYDDFELRLQWKTEDATDNSGVFVRFPNPGNDPGVAINEGHEVQIREGVQGDGENQKTGSIYNFDREDARAAKPAGEWNDYEIEFEDGTYTITLNGTVVNTWANTSDQGRSPGYIGIQNHGAGDAVSFRNIRVRHIGEPPQPNLFTTIGITRSETRANSGIFGTPTRYSLPAEEMPPSGTVGPAPEDTLDEVPLRMPDTSGDVPNLAAFRGQALTLRPPDQKTYSKIHFFGTTTDGGPAGGNFVLRFSDNTTQSINVQFRDWCAPQNTPGHHQAIGPLTKRHRETGEDGAQCGIYHVPGDVTAGKTLVSVTLPPDTTPAGTNTQAYLMALTLEEPGGTFETPDLSGQLQFPDDQTAPVSSHTLNPAAPGGQDGWYTDGVTVTVTAADEAGGSGVARTQYRINGGIAQDYTAPVPVATEGEVRFEYRSIDQAGNAEGFKAVDLKVDGTAPTTTARVSPETPRGDEGWDDGAVELTLTARDGTGSGIEATELRIGAGDWQPYDGTLTIAQDGVYDIAFRSTDVAGNVEAEQALEVKVDATAPATTATLASDPAGTGGVHRAPVTVSLAATDGASGVAASEFRLDGGAWQAYGGAFTVSALGGHIVEFRSRDRAGNLENAKEVAFAIAAPQGAPPDDGAPAPEPFVGLMAVDRVGLATLVRGDLRVRAVCTSVGRGTLSLTVSGKVARRLGLGRRTTLASRAVRCGSGSRISTTLEPSRKVKRALRRADGTFAATLRLTMRGSAGMDSDTERLVLRG